MGRNAQLTSRSADRRQRRCLAAIGLGFTLLVTACASPPQEAERALIETEGDNPGFQLETEDDNEVSPSSTSVLVVADEPPELDQPPLAPSTTTATTKPSSTTSIDKPTTTTKNSSTTKPKATIAPATSTTVAPTTKPSATDAPTTTPSVTKAPTTAAPATNPPATEPPVTKPPTTAAPATAAPMTNPPATNPPVTEAPTTAAPVTNPPATNPPATAAPNPPPTTPAPGPTPVGAPTKVGTYAPHSAGFCIGHEGTSPQAGARVGQHDCSSEQSADVRFLLNGGGGAGQLQVGSLCVTVKGGATGENAPVTLEDCSAGDESQWVPIDWRWGGGEWIMLRNRKSGLCLEPDRDGGGGAGVGFVQNLCNPGDHRQQLWNSDFADGLMASDRTDVGPVNAVSHGTKDFSSFHNGTYSMGAWTYGDIAFYAPADRVTDDMARTWMAWYAHMDALHERVWNNPDFESVYRQPNDANFGKKKVVALIDDGLCSCGNKRQAEALGFTPRIIEDPNNWVHHWILFYEMNRGGRTPDFYARATWPATHQGGLILPHMMAGLAFYELGGPAGLERDVPGEILRGLRAWELNPDRPALADQEIPADTQMAILLQILQDRGTDTFIQVLHNMAEKPLATSASQALCDFRSAINEATGNQYDAKMTNDWRLPGSC